MTAASHPQQPYGLPRQTTAQTTVAQPARTGGVTLPGRTNADTNVITAPPRTQLQQTWDSFRAHKAAFIGLCVLGTMIVVCALLPFVLQDPAATDIAKA